MIEHTVPKVIVCEGMPVVISSSRAVLPCGCSVFLGVRMDRLEDCVAVVPCSQGHIPMMEDFWLLYTESTKHPRVEPALEVCEELLKIARGARGLEL